MLDQIDYLISVSARRLSNLKNLYILNLKNKTISIDLLNEVRGILSDLRDPLDYLTKLIYKEKFPIANSDNDFKNKTKGCPSEIVRILQRYQDYDKTDKWLKYFSALSNIHKHIRLVPQIRTEKEVTNISPNTLRSGLGGRIGLNSNSSISFKPGGFISLGSDGEVNYSGIIFSGQASINNVAVDNQTNRPVYSPDITTSNQIWVNFLFNPHDEELIKKLGSNVNIEVLPFLQKSLEIVKLIVEEVILIS